MAQGEGFKYRPMLADDLEMVVKCFFGRMNAEFHTLFVDASDVIQKKAKKIDTFWKKQLTPLYWQNLLKSAQKSDYKAIMQEISHLLK